MRDGKVGKQEGMFIIALALLVNALFAPDPAMAYGGGNSAYVTVPLALGVSFLLYTAVRRSMLAIGAEDLNGLLEQAWGSAGVAAAAIIAFSLIFCAYRPLINFLDVMSNLVYVDSSGRRIVLYVLPAVAFAAFLGFEPQARSARLYGPFLVASLLITAFTARASFAAYRMTPVISGGGLGAVEFSLSTTVLFVPPLLGSLILARGLHGIGQAGRLAGWAALTACVLAAAALAALALTFTYSELGDMVMPISKLNTKMQQEIGVMRLDKLAVFTWLSACMLAAAWEVYTASFLFAKACGQNDVRPAVVCFSALLFGACVCGEGGNSQLMGEISNAVYGWGGAVLAALLLLTGAVARMRHRRRADA